MSYWERVVAGAVGGGLIVAALSNFSTIQNLAGMIPGTALTIIIAILGIFAIYYGRYG